MRKRMFLGAMVLSAAMLVTAADLVVSVPSGVVTNGVIDTDDRVVLMGPGTCVLQDGNRFGGGFVVTNGTLVADYVASGLKDTHLDLVGTANNRAAVFRPKAAGSRRLSRLRAWARLASHAGRVSARGTGT